MCLGEDPLAHAVIEGRRDDRCEQLPGIAIRQALESQLGQPAQFFNHAGLALGEEQEDRLCRQAPSDEREHLSRRPIDPLHVIDDDMSSGCSSAASDSRLSTASPTRNRSGCGPSSGQRRSRARHVAGPATARDDPGVPRRADGAPRTGAPSPTQPQAREGPDNRRQLDGVVEQGRLADPGFAPEHQHRAPLFVRFRDQPIEPRTLVPPAGQGGLRPPWCEGGSIPPPA